MKNQNNNITLIGMAGAGKSTIGLLLAKKLGFTFVDSDDLISSTAGMPLQDIVNSVGPEGFGKLEEKVLLGIAASRTVIATGGSAVYSNAGMEHLRRISCIVFLEVDIKVLSTRGLNLDNRGLLNPSGASFADLYKERHSLYVQYADHSINCSKLSPQDIVHALEKVLHVEGK